MSKIALFLEEKRVPQKIAFSLNADTQMTENAAYYPGLASVLGPLGNARDGLSSANADVLALKSQLVTAEQVLGLADKAHDIQLNVTASFVEQVTLFNDMKMEAGGFTLAKTPEPIGLLPAPGNIRTKPGVMPGTTNFAWKRDTGAKSFIAQRALDPAGPWETFYLGTKASCIAPGLTSGVLNYFRVAAIGSAGQSPWSDISESRAP